MISPSKSRLLLLRLQAGLETPSTYIAQICHSKDTNGHRIFNRRLQRLLQSCSLTDYFRKIIKQTSFSLQLITYFSKFKIGLK